jgi:hypothetical protein
MSTVTFDVVRASTKYVVDENGDLSQVAANTPAFEYNADGTYKGMLVEEERENICLQSGDWSVSPWVAFTAGAGLTPVVTADAGTAPDGTNNATRIQLDCDDDTVVANRSAWRQPITISNSTEYTVSFWYKAYDSSAIGDTVRVEHNNFAGAGLITITLTADWQRYSFTGTSSGTSTSFLIETKGGSTGQTADILVWGAQFEAGDNASSYIPTTTTSVTRNADEISKTSASTYIGQTSGTVYIEAIIPKLKNRFVISISDGSALGEAIYLQINPSLDLNVLIRTGGSTTTMSIADASWTAGLNKIAYTYEAGTDNSALFLNGASPITGTSANIPTCDKITLGSRPDSPGGLALNGWIRAFALYKRTLTDTEAIALTS